MSIELVVDAVADELEWLDPPPVFVGGAIVGLFLDALGRAQLRPTEDVDCIVPTVVDRTAWWRLESELRARKWAPVPDGPLCRYRSPAGHIVDLMTEDPDVLGFSGRWYPSVVRNAEARALSTGREILVPTPALLLACKLEAYSDRGASDPLMSEDLEDVSALLDGCGELEESIRRAAPEVRSFISARLDSIVRTPTQMQALLGHVPRGGDFAGQEKRIRALLDRLSETSG